MSQPCGCRVVHLADLATMKFVEPFKIDYCPLHASAGELREALIWAMKRTGKRGTATYENNYSKAQAALAASERK